MTRILSLAGFAAAILAGFCGAVHAADILTVGSHGASYKTIQAAINAIPAHSRMPVAIKIAAGTYRELVTIPSNDSNIILEGAGARKTIITYHLAAKDKGKNGKIIGTFHTPTVTILGRHIIAENLTFENSRLRDGQAVAVRTGDGPVVFRNCRFLAWQDTLYVHNAGAKIFLTHCFIQGAIDFIFGKSTAIFDHCTIHSVGSACITAPATPKKQKYGLVFLHCRLTAAKNVRKASVYLGRPWRPYGNTTYIQCRMGSDIAPAGWLNWQGTSYYKTSRFSEFSSTGPGADANNREKWSRQLTKTQAARYTVNNIMGKGTWH